MKKLIIVLTVLFCSSFEHNLVSTYWIHGTFEDGSGSISGKLNQNCPGLDCTVPCNSVVDTARLGLRALKSTVSLTDPLTGGSHRCESLVIRADSTQKDMYYAYSFYPRDWILDQSNGLINQFYPAGYVPVGAMWLKSDPTNSYLYLQYVRQVDTVNASFSAPVTTTTVLTPHIPINKWTDISFQINWQWNYTGFIKIYINGVLTATINGANTKKPFDITHVNYPNFRFGWYWFGYASHGVGVTNRTIYYDEVKEGDSTMSISDFILPKLAVDATPSSQTITLPTNTVHVNSTTTNSSGYVFYNWSKILGPLSGTIVTPTSYQTDITGLSAGTYKFELRATDDISIAKDTVTVTVNNPSSTLGATISKVDPTCNGFSNGTLTANYTGSTGTVTFLWNTGQTTQTITKPAGTYSVTVNDAAGSPVTVIGTINNPPKLLAYSSAPLITTPGGTTTVTVTSSGGTGSVSGTGDFTESAGSHTYTVTDANNCTATTTIVLVDPVTHLPRKKFKSNTIFRQK